MYTDGTHLEQRNNRVILFRVFCGIRSIGMIATLDKPSFLNASMRALSWELKGFRRNVNGIRTARDKYGNVFTFSPYWKSSLLIHKYPLARFNPYPKGKNVHDDAQDDGGGEARRVGSQRHDREDHERNPAPHLPTTRPGEVREGKRQAGKRRQRLHRDDAWVCDRYPQGKV